MIYVVIDTMNSMMMMMMMMMMLVKYIVAGMLLA